MGDQQPTAEPESRSVFAMPPLGELRPETDQFGHLDYAETIATVLREAKPPFTLGLYGPWGVGKTLVIKAACEQLREECAYAIYDAWRYDGDTLRRHLLRDVAKTLEANGELESSYKVDEKLKDLDVETVVPKDDGPAIDWKYFRFLVLTLGAVMLIGALVLLLFVDEHRLWAWLAGIGGGVLALAIASFTSPFARVIKVTQVNEIRHRVVDPEVFTAKFEELLRNVKKQRLVVAIDNLDRCSPKRVTELLETLNTYLEPVGNSSSGADAVFLVAADDGALKRHIESQEAMRSEGLEKDARLLRIDVGRYADEYLRKIFTTTIPIKPALATELKAYVAEQVKLLAELRGLNDEKQNENLARLVEVIAEGLRRNPRRVSQFVKNLELRLRLLHERHASEKMADDLSTAENIPFVAKLLILEEEFPEAYTALELDKALLSSWQAEQAAEVGGDGADHEKFQFSRLENLTADQTRQFAAFLGVTRAVESSQLAAFLSLKQSEHEVSLPRWADFRDALLTSDSSGLSAITEAFAPGEAKRYAATLMDIAGENSGYPNTIRVLVETAVGDEVLRREAPAELRKLLAWALNDPARRAQLRSVSPENVLPLAPGLSKQDFNTVARLYAEASADDEQMLPVDAFTALPPETADLFDANTVALLKQALTAEDLAAESPQILKFLQWWKGGASTQLATASSLRLAAAPDPRSVEADILEISLETVWQAGGGKERDQILSAAAPRLARFYNPAEPTDVADRVAAISRLTELARQLGNAGGAPGADRVETINSVNATLDQARAAMNAAEDVGPALDFAGTLAGLGSVPTSAATIQGLVAQFRAQLPDALFTYARERGEEVPPLVVPELERALASYLISDNAQALAGLIALTGSRASEVVRPHLEQAVVSGRFDFVQTALQNHPEELKDLRSLLASSALTQGTPQGLLFALKNSSSLNSAGKDSLAQALGQQIISAPDGDEPRRLLESIETSAIADRAPSVVGQLWDAAKAQPTPPIALLRLIIPRWSALTTTNKEAFTARAEEWFSEGAGDDLADAIGDTKIGRGRTRLVKAVIAYQASPNVVASDLDRRQRAFITAQRLAANSADAKRVVDSATDDLAKGSPSDQELHGRLRPSA